MTLAINTVDECGLSNKACREILPKKIKKTKQQEVFHQLYNTYKIEHLSYKSGYAMQVAKLLKEDWSIYICSCDKQMHTASMIIRELQYINILATYSYFFLSADSQSSPH